MLEQLHWFHAFKRLDSLGTTIPKAVIHVLRHGPRAAPPEIPSKTREHEQRLGLADEHVYAYLGRTDEEFGSTAYMFERESAHGNVCPFDTGGLFEHIEPIQTWDDAIRKAYFERFSFGTRDLVPCLREYPGDDATRVAAYLRGDSPRESGPHDLWGGDGLPAIWAGSHNSWRSWTWELRMTEQLPAGPAVRYWTCPNDVFSLLFDNIVDIVDDDEAQAILSKYVEGGVSTLLALYQQGDLP